MMPLLRGVALSLTLCPLTALTHPPPVVDMYITNQEPSDYTRVCKEDIEQLEMRLVQLDEAMGSLSLLLDESQKLKRQVRIFQEKLSTQPNKKQLQDFSLLQNSPSLPRLTSSGAQRPKARQLKQAPQVIHTNPRPSASAKAAWHKAFNLLKKGQYQAAKHAFEEFVKQHPKHANCAIAQYFLGKLALLQASPDRALACFKSFMAQKPKDKRIPDVQLHIGLAYYAKGDNIMALRIFRKIQTQYPNSQAAQIAHQQLKRLKADV